MAFLTVNTVYARFCFSAIAAVVSLAISAAEVPTVVANPANPTPSAIEPVEENVEITCEAGCEKYSEGSLTCMNNAQFQCGKKGWQKTDQDQTCQPKSPPSPTN